MLHFLDVFYTILHLLFIGFNMFAWIWPKTRKAHLVTIMLTAASWFVLGIWFGWGYCPITDWQWQVKERLGETHLPASFIEYYGEKITGTSINTEAVNIITLATFLLMVILSVYVNFLKRGHR